jgi:hypothetical protein
MRTEGVKQIRDQMAKYIQLLKEGFELFSRRCLPQR